MDRTPDSQGFRHLWPTVVLQRSLPGAEAANTVLSELILAADGQAADMTVDYRADNFLESRHPAVDWLRQCINKTAIDYLTHCGLDYELRWSLQGWANVNRFGDYHDLHNHPHSYLSGTYYVAVPADQEKLEGRSDRRPGAISFYDPRAQANMTAIKGDPQVEAEHTVLPTPGTILLWPAFLHHFVHPNLSRSPRISISFNLVLKRDPGYLPDQ
jgi:uncharacterized protein (TIGR02466 family)